MNARGPDDWDKRHAGLDAWLAAKPANGPTGDDHDPAKPHPWANTIDAATGRIKAIPYLIHGVIAAGFTIIGGERGVGKTTALLPMFMRTCHLCHPSDPLMPAIMRRVVYITEDIEQAQRVLRSYRLTLAQDNPDTGQRGIKHSEELLNDRLKLVEATRMSPIRMTEAGDYLRGLAIAHKRKDGTIYLAPPVVVLDTLAANVIIGEENNNAEASGIIATLRQKLGDIPIVIVAHSPKRSGNTQQAQQTIRGASALEADAQQVAYLTRDEFTGHRYLSITEHAKKRFTSDVDQVEFTQITHTVMAINELGEEVMEQISHAEAAPMRTSDRLQLRDTQQEEQRRKVINERRTTIINALEAAQKAGRPLMRNELAATVGYQRQLTSEILSVLMGDGFVIEVDIPLGRRWHHKRANYLIALDGGQKDEHIRTGRLTGDALTEWQYYWRTEDHE